MKIGKIYTLSVLLLLATVAIFATRKYTNGDFCIFVPGSLSPYFIGFGTPSSNLTIGGLFPTPCKVSDVNREQFPLYLSYEAGIFYLSPSGW
jgi:hypothetical protein